MGMGMGVGVGRTDGGAWGPGSVIRGRVGPKALRNSAETFDQSICTVLSELLQNARRAGASRIDVTARDAADRDGIEVTVADDGRGVADWADLATYGGSGWDAGTDAREGASGMGMYALASRGMEVRSGTLSVRLTRDSMEDREDAVLESCDAVPGTSVTFRERGGGARWRLRHAMAAEATYHPVPITLDGAAWRRKGFLDGAVRTAEFEGVTIGVFDTEEPQDGYAARDGLRMNFHGHRASVPTQTDVRLRDGDRRWCVRYDVTGAASIVLLRPARASVIVDEAGAWNRLRAAAAMEAYRAVAAGTHRLGMHDVRKIRACGIAIEDPQVALRPWRPPGSRGRNACDPVTDPARLAAAVVAGEMARAPRAAVVQAAEAAGVEILAADEDYVGAAAYDGLRHVGAVAIKAVGADGRRTVAFCGADDDMGSAGLWDGIGVAGRVARVASLEARIMTAPDRGWDDADAGLAPVAIGVALADAGGESGDPGDICMLVSGVALEDVGRTADRLAGVLFSQADFDDGKGSVDGDGYRRAMETEILRAVQDPLEFGARQAADAARRGAADWGLHRAGSVASVSVRRVEACEGQEAHLLVTATGRDGRTTEARAFL